MTFAQIKSKVFKYTGKHIDIAKWEQIYFIYNQNVVWSCLKSNIGYVINENDLEMIKKDMEWIDKEIRMLSFYYKVIKFFKC